MKADKTLICLLLFGFALNTLAIDWGIPNSHSWNPDDIAPDTPLRISDAYTKGWHRYPYLQSWIDFAIFSPVLFYWATRGTYLPGCNSATETCFNDPYGQLSVLIILSRILAAIMALGTVYWTYRTSLLVFRDRLAALLGALILTCSNVFVFHAQLGNVDVPYLFWFAWSLYYYARLLETNEVKNYLAFGFLSACALATKESIVGAYVLIGVTLYALHVKRLLPESKTPGLGRRLWAIHCNLRLVGLLAVLLLTYSLINNVFFNWQGFTRHFAHWVGSDAPGIAPYARVHLGSGWLLKTFGFQLKDGMGLAFLLLCVGGLIYGLKRNFRVSLLLIVPIVSYYLFTIQMVHFTYKRFGLPVIVLLSIFGGVFAAYLSRSKLAPLSIPVIVVAFAQGILMSANTIMTMRNDSRYATEQWLLKHIPNTEGIGVFGLRTYVPRFGLLGYEMELLADDLIRVDYLTANGPRYLVLTSAYHVPSEAPQKKVVDALFSHRLNYRIMWDYRYESPLKPFLGDGYLSGFINPRITVFRREGDSL
jgi:hypothetical protein